MDLARIERALRRGPPGEPDVAEYVSPGVVGRATQVRFAGEPTAAPSAARQLLAMAGAVAVLALIALLAIGLPREPLGPAASVTAEGSTTPGAPVGTPDSGGTQMPTPEPTLVRVPTRDAPSDGGTAEACPAAQTFGLLVAHPDWGIALADELEGRLVRVLWPHGFAGRWAGDRLALVDGTGTVLAHVGDRVELGGGHTGGSWYACGDVEVLEPSAGAPSATPEARTLPTFPVDPAGACQDFQLKDPVAGSLTGDPEDIDMPIRLVGPQGRHSVVWPAGFTVAFEPTAVLYDEGGQPVAREGDMVELAHVWQGQATGSNFNPYHAAGMVFGKCYAREGAAAVAIRSAVWRLDPAFGEPRTDTATLQLRAIGDACSGEPTAGDRLLEPVVEYTSDAVLISLRIAGIASGECAGRETEFSATVDLEEALGDRRLLDGTNEPAAERWPAAPFPVVEVADLGRSLEDRIDGLVGAEGCAHVAEVQHGPWQIERIERDAAELPGGVGLVGPNETIYVGQPQDAALAFGGFEAVHDGERWGLVGPYVDEPWLTGFGVDGEWAAAQMAEIELSGGRSAWAAGIEATVIGQEQCRE